MKWIKALVGLGFYVFAVLAFILSPWYLYAGLAGVTWLIDQLFTAAGVQDLLDDLIKLPPPRSPGEILARTMLTTDPPACPQRGMFCDCRQCSEIMPETGTTFVTQRRLDNAADDAGIKLGHVADPSAARGQFWLGPVLGVGGQLATDREAQERADYELVKKKLAGMQNHPAGKGKS